jgi:hypothetical protein
MKYKDRICGREKIFLVSLKRLDHITDDMTEKCCSLFFLNMNAGPKSFLMHMITRDLLPICGQADELPPPSFPGL